MHAHAMLIIAGVLGAGMVCQWLAWRLKIPAILPLLITGFIAGPLLGILHPQESLGELFFPVISLSVAVILFEGALTLTWRDVRSVAASVRNLISVGAAITWIGGALAGHYLMNLPWALALLFGALIIVTGPTVIAPLLHSVRPTAKIASVLRWESILIDPIGATVAVLIFDFIIAGVGATFSHMLLTLLWIVVEGTLLGMLGGYVICQLLQRHLIPDYLRDATTLALVLLVFSVSNALASESGLLAVTVMGVYLANTELRQLREIFYFKEKLTVMLISSLFILLAANIPRSDLALLDWRSLLVLVIVIFILRPLGVFVSAQGSELSHNERLFVSWIAPRGIVAAAISSLFAYELVARGYSEAAIVAPLTFLIIVGTVLLQGSTAKWVARRLGVVEADPQGFLVMGANRLAQELALALKPEGVTVRLIDANAYNVTNARLRGLDAAHNNLLSDYVETNLDLAGIGRLLALTNNDEANALACQHFEDEFGSQEVYQLPPHLSGRSGATPNPYQLGRLLFAPDVTYQKLNQMLDAGAVIKKTPLTAQFTLQDFWSRYKESEVVPLMAIKGKKIQVWTVQRPPQPEAGWTIMSLLLDPAASTSRNGARRRERTEEREMSSGVL
jgi:NhaP-type Na+/H+ or K+/H+ antiporter